jgi:hypothetical protein
MLQGFAPAKPPIARPAIALDAADEPLVVVVDLPSQVKSIAWLDQSGSGWPLSLFHYGEAPLSEALRWHLLTPC